MEKVNQNIIMKDYEEYAEYLKEKNIFTKSVSNAFLTVLVLWFLTKRDYHGYSLMKKIDEFFDVQINIGLTRKTQANKIYPLLKKLEENDLIESYDGTHKKKKVKLYKLTEDGLKLHNFNKFISNQNSKNELWNEFYSDFNIQDNI